MSPESDWKLSDTRDPKKPEASYCTLTRGFSQGVVLTIARNPRAETSLAFDFRKNIFSKDKTYTVAMNAGPGARRAFEARPVSPEALVISTGKDDAFYAGIRKGGKLDISISGTIYSFDIDGLGDAFDRLTFCSETLNAQNTQTNKAQDPSETKNKPDIDVAAASKVVKSPSSSAKSPAENKTQQKPLSETTGIAKLKEENQRLAEMLEKERRSYENKALSASDGNAIIELREKVSLLEKENQNLRMLSHAPSAPEGLNKNLRSEDKNRKMEDDLATLKTENARLRQSLQEEKSAKIEVPESVSPKAFAALKEQYESLKAENERLKESIKLAENKTPDAPLPATKDILQSKALEEKLSAAEKRIDFLSKESDRLRSEKEKALLEKSGDNWGAEEATKRYNEADREARRLSVLLDEKTTQCAEEKSKLEAMLFDPAVTNKAQIAHLAELEENLQKARSSAQTNDSICQARITEAERRAASDTTDSMKKKMDSLEAALANSKKTSELAQSYEKKMHDLQAALDEAKSSAKVAVDTLEQKTKESSLTQDSLKKTLEKKDQEYGTLLASLKQEKADLQKKLDAAVTKSSDASEEEKAAIAQEIMTAKADLARKDSEYRQSLTRLEAEKDTLTAQLKTAQDQLSTQKPNDLRTARIAQEIESLRAEMAQKEMTWKQQSDTSKQETDKKIAILESEKKALQFALSQIGSAAGATSPSAIRRMPPPSSATQASFPPPTPTAPAPSSPSPQKRDASLPFMGVPEISSLLKSARLPLSEPVESVSPATETTARAFRWKSGSLFGSAEERGIDTINQFNDFVSDYVDRTRSRCSGDFASSQTDESSSSNGKIAAYEIACISGNSGASAALLFIAKNGIFTVIAHESGSESMDSAIDTRDRLYNALSTGS